MVLSAENILLIGSVLLFASIIASKTSYRFGIPTLIFFIIVGMLAGSDGPGGIYFNDPDLAQMLGVIALNFILFSGGMETNLHDVQPILWRGLSLSTIGVLVTAITIGAFASYITELNFREGLLLGAIVSSTDAAAVFSILRTRNIGLKGYLRPLLELESGSNDPMAYFLTISFIQIVQQPQTSIASLIVIFIQQMALGALSGWLMGRLIVFSLNKIKLDVDGLYPVMLMALMFFSFAATDFIGGNGFLAIYIAGIVAGNNEFIHKRSLIRFFDGQAWLMQIIMFLTLGLLVFPSQIVPLIGTGLLLALFLIFISRPLGVFLSLSFFKINLRNRLFLSWVGLRGAVPIVFATYPLLAGLQHAQFIFNLVFFISLSSVLLQGSTLPVVAKWLGVTIPSQVRRKSPFEKAQTQLRLNVYFDLILSSNSPFLNKELWQIKFPEGAYITMIRRDNEYFLPNGSTPLKAADHLFIASRNEEDKKVIEEMLNRYSI